MKKGLFISVVLMIPMILFGQYYDSKYQVADQVDEAKIKTLLDKPFSKSSVSFNLQKSPYFFFQLMADNELELSSSIYRGGPVASSVWEIKEKGLSMDVFIEQLYPDLEYFPNHYRLNSLWYSQNFSLDPVIRIGMNKDKLKQLLGPWNYEIDNSIIYNLSNSYIISCTVKNGTIQDVLIYEVIDV